VSSPDISDNNYSSNYRFSALTGPPNEATLEMIKEAKEGRDYLRFVASTRMARAIWWLGSEVEFEEVMDNHSRTIAREEERMLVRSPIPRARYVTDCIEQENGEQQDEESEYGEHDDEEGASEEEDDDEEDSDEEDDDEHAGREPRRGSRDIRRYAFSDEGFIVGYLGRPSDPE
jgi:hypothetical protein